MTHSIPYTVCCFGLKCILFFYQTTMGRFSFLCMLLLSSSSGRILSLHRFFRPTLELMHTMHKNIGKQCGWPVVVRRGQNSKMNRLAFLCTRIVVIDYDSIDTIIILNNLFFAIPYKHIEGGKKRPTFSTIQLLRPEGIQVVVVLGCVCVRHQLVPTWPIHFDYYCVCKSIIFPTQRRITQQYLLNY